ncbi:MAG: hypothetical protein KGJ13_07160 [Patescibacteria group bacterium]|nr:hypothetical protein [Patescibacteria group bacterium]
MSVRLRAEWPDGWVPNRLEAMAAWDRYDWNRVAEHHLVGRFFSDYMTCRNRAEWDYILERRELNKNIKKGTVSQVEFDRAIKDLMRSCLESLAVAFAEAMAEQKEVEG